MDSKTKNIKHFKNGKKKGKNLKEAKIGENTKKRTQLRS